MTTHVAEAPLRGLTVLVISPVVSDPAHSGNAVRTRQMCSALTELGATVHFGLVDINAIRSRRVDGVLEEVWGPRYHAIGGSGTFVGTTSQRTLRKAQSVVRRLRVPAHTFLDLQIADGFVSREAHRDVGDLVARLGADAVVVGYALLSALVTDLPDDPILVVDTHDRFTGRNARLRAEGPTAGWVSLTARQERRLLRRFDHVIAIQDEEAELFRHDLGRDAGRVAVADVLVPGTDVGEPPSPGVAGYIGSANESNRAALLRFLDLHWREIRAAVPDARLRVAGAEVAGLAAWREHGVDAVGRVPDVAAFYRGCAVVVNPVLSGSGLKIKSLEALQHGRPLVTTPEGIRGLRDAARTSILCADLSDPEFGRHVAGLLAEPARARRSGTDGVRFVNERAAASRATLVRCLTTRQRPGHS